MRHVEEEVIMNEDIRRAFDKVERVIGESGKETRQKIDDIHNSLTNHIADDRVMNEKANAHYTEHERTRKFRVALWIAVITAFVGALGTAIVEIVTHHH